MSYEGLLGRYEGHSYPDKSTVISAIQVVNDLLSQQKDNVVLTSRVLQREDNLYDVQEAMQNAYKPIFRQSLLKAARLESDAEIDAYVDKLRDQLKTLLKGSDGIELK